MTDPTAGDGLLKPTPLVALGLLLLNDHVLKTAAVGTAFDVVTGKLSDVCGVLFLPVLLVAGGELALAAVKRFDKPSVRVAVVVAVVVAACFALMKTVPAAGAVYAWSLGALQWPFLAAGATLDGRALPPVRAVQHVLDASDVVAVPFAFYVVAQARVRAFNWASRG